MNKKSTIKISPSIFRNGSGVYGGADSNTGNFPCGEAFYIGELGWGTSPGQAPCGGGAAFNSTAAAAINDQDNCATYGYWFLMGPLADPNYNGTTSEAYTWGQKQGNATDTAWGNNAAVCNEVIFADMENYVPCPGIVPANNGWDQSNISLNQQVWEGWYNTINALQTPGVYSSPDFWSTFMGNYALPSGVTEWTSEPQESGCPGTWSAESFGGLFADIWQFQASSADYDIATSLPNLS